MQDWGTLTIWEDDLNIFIREKKEEYTKEKFYEIAKYAVGEVRMDGQTAYSDWILHIAHKAWSNQNLLLELIEKLRPLDNKNEVDWDATIKYVNKNRNPI